MSDERTSPSRQPAERKMSPGRSITGEPQPGDLQVDYALRPRSLHEMIGQERLRDKMQILVDAARQRGDALDHVLLYGPPGLGKCITAQSLVITSQGMIPLGDLLPADLAANTYRERVLDVFGLQGLESTSHVYANGVGPVLRVRTRSGFEIEGTPNHPLLVATASGPQWKQLDRLTPHDFVAIARGTEVWGDATTGDEEENHFERQRGGRSQERMDPIVRRFGELAAQPGLRQNLGHTRSALHAEPIMAEQDFAPPAVLQGSRTVAIAFLRGLFARDGSVGPDGCVELGTRSQALAGQVQLLLANLGIIAQRTQRQWSGDSVGYLYIGGQDAVRFHEIVGCLLPRQRLCAQKPQAKPDVSILPEWLLQEAEFAALASLMNPMIHWDQVATIERSTAETFDFVVPNTHSFVANGFFNHNTTLSHILAHEMGGNLKVTAGPAVEKAGDLAAILTNLRKGDILFIDEIHRLGRAVEEILYPAMEDFSLNIIVGSGPGARNIQLSLPKFTVVGATTRLALLTSPLRARFGVVERFDFYDKAAIHEIVMRAATLLKAPIDPEGAQAIAQRARGTPRVALRLLRRLRDYAQVRANGHIDARVAAEALSLLEIDELGLDDLDRRVLDALIYKFRGGPVGLDTLAASISEEPDTIMDVVEPYLLQLGFLDRTPRGRVPTRAAYVHMKAPYPESPEQSGLFG